ncbi:MAG: flagellar biosynthetic protein FliO [Kiloniellales bacterium]
MDLDVYARFLLALLFILALIGTLAWLARRFGLGGRLVANSPGQRRLAIAEVLALDSRRKLVLLRRDDREHLVLLGPTTDLLVETGIAAPADLAARRPADRAGAPSPSRSSQEQPS